MKVLIVNKFLYPNGGSETYIFKLGEQLVKMGHEVQYFGMEHEGRSVGNHAEVYTSDMDFHGGGLGKLLYPFRIIYSTEAKRKMRLVLEDFKPDVVHLNNINFQLTPSVIYAVRNYGKKTGRHIRIVYTAHDYQWVCPDHLMRIPSTGAVCFACRGGDYIQCTKNRCIHNSMIKSLLGTLEAKYYARRKTYGMVDVIVCPSAFMKRQLDTDPLLADKTVVMHNFIGTNTSKQTEATDGMNVGQATPANDNDGRRRKDYVIYFGRFSEEKGTKTLLETCRALPDIPFVFAGTGPLEEQVNALPNVENHGFVMGEKLQELVTGARFSVHPSECYDNCPFAVMESQVYGTPVLVSDLGGAPELVQTGKTGELFRGGDVRELTEHIRALWDNPELCQRYSENCRDINFDTAEEYCDKIVRKVYS
ncbi:MAG: glycosyltransferase family 4 protein [Lachnospiraceae bacterium]|nr:glycosyltransferase family 4 protein [Lachnospiraceae bacterium]